MSYCMTSYGLLLTDCCLVLLLKQKAIRQSTYFLKYALNNKLFCLFFYNKNWVSNFQI